jgi:DNA topoisomerase-1
MCFIRFGDAVKVREHYEKLLEDSDDFKRQTGTAMWVIDRLALRVGGEKDEDEADTVGACSLRVEHLAFPSDHEVTFDFLGKDSMRYFQTIDVSHAVPP